MIIGLDIDDVIFNTSEYLGGILEDLQDNELNNLKLEIMRGNYAAPKVRDFLAKYLPQTVENAKIKEGASETITQEARPYHHFSHGARQLSLSWQRREKRAGSD